MKRLEYKYFRFVLEYSSWVNVLCCENETALRGFHVTQQHLIMKSNSVESRRITTDTRFTFAKKEQKPRKFIQIEKGEEILCVAMVISVLWADQVTPVDQSLCLYLLWSNTHIQYQQVASWASPLRPSAQVGVCLQSRWPIRGRVAFWAQVIPDFDQWKQVIGW